MLERCLDAIIWYVFEGAQCQISWFLFSIIMRMGHFLEQVSIRKLAPSFADTIFSRQLTSATWKMSFLQHFLRVSSWYWFGERRLSPNQYQDETRRILRKVQRGSLSSPWQLPPRHLQHQESLLLPTRYVQCLLDHYIVYIAKRLVVFAPKFAEKSPFWMHDWRAALCFPLQTSTTMDICAYSKDLFLC